MKATPVPSLVDQKNNMANLVKQLNLKITEQDQINGQGRAAIRLATADIKAAEVRLQQAQASDLKNTLDLFDTQRQRAAARAQLTLANFLIRITPLLVTAKQNPLELGDVFEMTKMDGMLEFQMAMLNGYSNAQKYQLAEVDGFLTLAPTNPTTVPIDRYVNWFQHDTKLMIKFTYIPKVLAASPAEAVSPAVAVGPDLADELTATYNLVLGELTATKTVVNQAAADVLDLEEKTAKLIRSISLLRVLNRLKPDGRVAVGDEFTISVAGRLSLSTAVYALKTKGVYFELRALASDKLVLFSLAGDDLITLSAAYCPTLAA